MKVSISINDNIKIICYPYDDHILDEKQKWLIKINKLLLNALRHPLNDNDDKIWSWKFRESEKRYQDDTQSLSNTNITNTCCFSPKIDRNNKKSFISDHMPTFRFSMANEEIGKGNRKKTMDKLLNDPKLIAKYAEYGQTKFRMHRIQYFIIIVRF